MTGYEAFSLYHVLKLHFTSEYDYFKYNGKTNITIESFERRRDKYHFYKLSRKYDTDDYKELVISCLLEDDKCWAGTLLEEQANDTHMKRMSVIQALSYNFRNDCMTISDTGKINDLLKTDGEYPELLTLVLQKEITLETVCILNSFMNFIPMWKRKITDDIRWPVVYRKIVKYTPFLVYNKDSLRKIALENLT